MLIYANSWLLFHLFHLLRLTQSLNFKPTYASSFQRICFSSQHRHSQFRTLRLSIARVFSILTGVHGFQLRTAQPVQIGGDVASKRLQSFRHILVQLGEQIWSLSLDELEDKTLEVVSLCECSGIEDAAGQVFRRDADEGVGGAGVATDLKEACVFRAEGEDVEDKAEAVVSMKF